LIDNRKFPIVLGEKIGVRSSGRFPITLVQALPFPLMGVRSATQREEQKQQ